MPKLVHDGVTVANAPPIPALTRISEPGWVVSAPPIVLPPKTWSWPWLTNGALRVEPTRLTDFPAALVTVPGPLRVELESESATVPVPRLGVRLRVVEVSESAAGAIGAVTAAVAPLRARVPAPVMEPAEWPKLPLPLIVSACPAPIVMAPVLVKLGVVPLCTMLRLPPESASVPELRWSAPARVTLVAIPIVIVPRLSRRALSARLPPAPAATVSVAPASLTIATPFSVPVQAQPVEVSSIAPRLVKAWAKVVGPPELTP